MTWNELCFYLQGASIVGLCSPKWWERYNQRILDHNKRLFLENAPKLDCSKVEKEELERISRMLMQS